MHPTELQGICKPGDIAEQKVVLSRYNFPFKLSVDQCFSMLSELVIRTSPGGFGMLGELILRTSAGRCRAIRCLLCFERTGLRSDS